MGAVATAPQAPPRAAPAPALRPELVRLAALAPLALFGALHWAALLDHPPNGRVVLMLMVALTGGLVLLGVPAGAPRPRRALTCAVVTLALLVAALLTAGVPLRFLAPACWDDLVSGIAQGIASTPAIRVPYRGVDPWVRVAIAAGATALLVLAVLLATWPRSNRHGRPLAAAVALGVLYALPVVEHDPGHPYLGGTLFCVLLGAYLYAERLRSDQLALAAVSLLAVALLGAAIAPRLDAGRPWLDYEALAEKLQPTKAEGFTWDHSYGPLHWPRDGREILRIGSRAPLYWKAVNLEAFDGRRWLSGLPRDDRTVEHPNPRWIQTVRVVDRGLRSAQFVTAGDTLRILPGSSLPALWVPDETYVSAGAPLGPGDSYSAQVYVPRPTEAQLRRASVTGSGTPQGDLDVRLPVALPDRDIPNPFPPGGTLGPVATVRFAGFGSVDGPGIMWNSGTVIGSGTRILRDGPYARLYALTRRLVAQSSGPYDAAQRILRRVRDGAVYDESPPPARYPLASFLFEERRGYCQQFSGTMALMLRMAGIPARVASGFSPGARDTRRGDYVVEDTDAHSWVEAYFAPYGWITLDPTPGASPARSQTDDTAGGSSSSSGRSRRTGSGVLGQSGDRPFALGDPGARLAPVRPGTDWRAIGAGGTAVLAGLIAAIVLWRRRPRFVPSAPELAELERALWRTGRSPAPSTTLAHLESLLGSGDAGATYVRAVREQRYAGTGSGPTAAHRRALRRELGAGLGIAGALRGWFALPPRWPSRGRRARPYTGR
ncbi:MAG: transglutaminase-like domain-containing protein [Solirubrobacteraceae bacterium]